MKKVKKINHQKIIDKTPHKDLLKVEMKNSEGKGMGVFATKKIFKDEIIAFYRVKVYKTKGYESPTDFVYSFEVYKKNGNPYKTLIADIYRGSFIDPVTDISGKRELKEGGHYISYWGPFLNEPNKSKGEKVNAEVDLNLKEQYKSKNKKTTQEGDIVTYSIVATRDIEPGEELMWYYGSAYPRDY